MDTINCIQRAIDFIDDNIYDEIKSEVGLSIILC